MPEGSAETALHHLREIMGKLKLAVNEEKTRICKVPEGEFDFWNGVLRSKPICSPTTGKSPLGPPAVKKASSAWSKSPRADRPARKRTLARDHRARRHVEPRASRGGGNR